MPADSLRALVVAAIKPHVPETWRFIPNQDTPEKISRVTVVLKHLEIFPLEEAPRRSLRSPLVLTILNPLVDDAKAENALDDDVLTLVHALQNAASWMRFDSARKVRDDKNNCLGWDVTVTAITNNKE